MKEDSRSANARYASFLQRDEAEEKASVQRHEFRALVFQAALESAVRAQHRQADASARQMFVCTMDPARGLQNLFAEADARHALERRCTVVQLRAGVGLDRDGLNPIRVFTDTESGQLHGLASDLVSRLRDKLQRMRVRTSRRERLQWDACEGIIQGANEGSIPLGVVRAFAMCADLSRHLLATGIISRSSLHLLDIGFYNRFLDGKALTHAGVDFFRGIQLQLLSSFEDAASKLFTRIARELSPEETATALAASTLFPGASRDMSLAA